MKVWVIIPMHNFAELTDECVDYVKKHAGIEHEILVVDDCSKKAYKNDKVKVARLKQHSGFSKAINFGLRLLQLNYDYVCILNNDTLPEPNFLKHMVETAKKDPQIGIVGASRIMGYDPYKVSMWGTDLTTGQVACSLEDLAEPSQAIWIPFCCVLFSQACVQAVGLLDEKMINHCSDNDYCLRALFMDFAVVHEPKAKVFHYQSKTVESLGLEPYDDQITFARKWFGVAMNEILKKIPINEPLGKWGEIGFKYTTKEQEVSGIIKP